MAKEYFSPKLNEYLVTTHFQYQPFNNWYLNFRYGYGLASALFYSPDRTEQIWNQNLTGSGSSSAGAIGLRFVFDTGLNNKQYPIVEFTNTKICEDYFFKCNILKRINYAFCFNKILTRYRIRKDSLQGNNFKNLYWIWKINKMYNKLNFFENILSIISISINSLKRYGLKNVF